MNRRAEKLLGGYAAGTLNAEERRLLFAAALENQELFDALVREQALRDLLEDPAARARLVAALEGPPAGLAARVGTWLRRPRALGLAAGAAAALIAVAVFVPRGAAPEKSEPFQVAQLPPAQAPAGPEAATPEPAPRPARTPQPAPIARRRREETPPAAPRQAAAGQEAAEADAAAETTAAAPARAPARSMRTAVEFKEAPALRYSVVDQPRAGQAVSLQFESRESGWLYVFIADPQGWRLLAAAPIEAGKAAIVPLHFDAPGRRELLALVSHREEPELRAGGLATPPPAAASQRIFLEIAP